MRLRKIVHSEEIYSKRQRAKDKGIVHKEIIEMPEKSSHLKRKDNR